MEIYKGNDLVINYSKEDNLFIQEWIISPTLHSFKKEMLVYTKLYEKYRPHLTLWLQQKFTLNIDSVLTDWIEAHVNKPCLSYGNRKCAFVVSEDVFAHISVINSFDKIESCIIPKHFLTEEEAMSWLNGTAKSIEKSNHEKVTYNGIDEKGNAILKLPIEDIKSTLKTIQHSFEQESFIKKNRYTLETLTKREKEILGLIINGNSNKNISEILHISSHTVRTHRNRIWKKLEIKHLYDCLKYQFFFK